MQQALNLRGLSSAPAIGVTVAELVRDLLNAEEKSDFNPVRHGILDPDKLSLEERNQLIKRKPGLWKYYLPL